jgi:signal transduction histidine kinase/ActR/RegA family two-component response regulator
MVAVVRTQNDLLDELKSLRLRLEEAEETLRAISAGEVDALVVDGVDGEQIFTLEGADHPYRVMVESMGEGALTVNSEGTIVYCNESFANMVSTPVERVLGSTVVEYLAPADRKGYTAFLNSGKTHKDKLEVRLASAGETLTPVLISRSLPQMTGMVCLVVTDLSEHKHNLELLASQKADKTLNEQRESLLIREQALRLEAERANRSKEEFLATVSHELRTPLNAVLGWATMLRRGKLDPDTFQRGIESIERNARSQAQLIEDLLDISRITTGKLRLDVKPIRLISVITGAIDSIQPAADAKGVQLEIVLDPSVDQIDGDASRLQQIVWNCLSNSVKFTPAGGKVRVQLERKDSVARITIADTGAGIDREFLPHVFGRFQQADGAMTRAHSGLGLGLAIARHLVEIHGGTIEANSDGLGHGATFTISLPISRSRKATDAEDARAASAEQSSAEILPNLGGLRILTIDDESDTRDLVRIVLEGCGANVMTAGSAREGLETLAGWRPHVLICDIGMPDEDGYSVIRKVRASAEHSALPAIALTAYVRVEDRMRALDAGYQMFLPKPVEAAELRSTVANVVARGFAQKGSQ